MPEIVVGFVDAGFLRAEGGRELHLGTSPRVDATGWVAWFRNTGNLRSIRSQPTATPTALRSYWYDGAHRTDHHEYKSQRAYLDAIAYTENIQLRLGHIVEHSNQTHGQVITALRKTAQNLQISEDILLNEFRNHIAFLPDRKQKGVDTLITLDMLQLAQRNVYTTAVLVSGDADLVEAVRAVQDLGKRVVLVLPHSKVAPDLRKLADQIVIIPRDALTTMIAQRGAPGLTSSSGPSRPQ